MGPMLIFFEGELIVRDDLKYPEGVLVVDGRDARGDLLVRPLGGGFQFILPSAEVARFQRVEPAETIEVFSPGTYALEGLDGKFAGWSDGSCWFGWEKPGFSREVAEGIVRATGRRWTYEERTDEFVMANSSSQRVKSPSPSATPDTHSLGTRPLSPSRAMLPGAGSPPSSLMT